MEINLNTFNDLKESLTCQECKEYYEPPFVWKTCNHFQCRNNCSKSRNACPTCKNAFQSKTDSTSHLTDNIIEHLKAIDEIFKKSDSPHTSPEPPVMNGFEMVILTVTMKRNAKGETPLHLACKKGDLDKVKQLVKSGVDFNMTDWANWTPLHEAVQKAHIKCVEYLAETGALLNVPGQSYITPLHEAIVNKHLDVAQVLIKYGADVNALDYMGVKPFEHLRSCNLDLKQDFEIIPRVFISNEIIVYGEDIAEGEKTKLITSKVKICKRQDFLQKDFVTHFIVKNDKLCLNILLAILKGIFIVDNKWIDEHLNASNKIDNLFNTIIQKYKKVNTASIKNRLLKYPKLFDGINFHITDHEKSTLIEGLKLKKSDLELLIKSGGGKVVVRPPALRTVEGNYFYPYHAMNNLESVNCNNYIIYEEDKKHELLYRMRELKHKSSKWLIECILSFKILE